MKFKYLCPCLLLMGVCLVAPFTASSETQFQEQGLTSVPRFSSPAPSGEDRLQDSINRKTQDQSTPLGRYPDRSLDSANGYTGSPGVLPSIRGGGDPQVKDLSNMDAGISGPGTPGGPSLGR